MQIVTMGFFTALNIFALGLMGWDKHRSRVTGADRIPEGLLFFLAVMGGSLGVFFGMFLFRHKTRTPYFLVGIPMAGVQNVLFARFIIEWIAHL